jgi:alpha-tubulin suppressor-like RCC1 family protein
MWGTFRVFSINKTQSGSCIVANGTTCYTIPTLINDSNQFVAIQGGESHFVALTETGDVYTWGIGAQGQLGRPFYESKVYNDLQPTRVFFSQQIEKIYACGFHSFFITKNQVFGCGKNGFGELGLGHVNTIYHPQKLPLENISQIAGGLHHCLFLSNGSIWATGKNSDGQLGLDQSIEFTSSPIKLSISDIEFISCGVSSHHSCILD